MSKQLRIIGGVAAVLLLIGGTAIFADVGADARAPRMGVKGDRLDLRPLGSNCSQRGWPYYESECLRDRLKPGGQQDGVRRIGVNREVFKIAQSHTHDRRQQF
ncbi:MAG: hypothetical protein JO230_32020 [Xanthobacteraceae bacterium]|nr:hypothetical protein [Xanthobacteraceae bacterium]